MSDLISREDAVALVIKAIHGTDNKEIQEYLFDGLRKQMWSLPSAESTGAMDEAIQEYIKDGYMQPIGEDLISRQAAIYELEHIMGDHPLQGYEDERLLINALESLPSAEPKTGKWVLDPNGMDWNIPAWRCSECGFVANYIGVEAKGFGNNPMNWAGSKFCPQCGARITGYER